MSNHHPPRWILGFLQLFCPPGLLEEIEGDLLQRFSRDAKNAGMFRAKWNLVFSVVMFFRPGIILRNKFSFNTNPLLMLSNYLKVSTRVMYRNKAFTTINVSGLVLGMTGALLLSLWILHETSFDKFHRDHDRLFLAWNRGTENGQVNASHITPRVLAPTLEKEFASVEKAISYADWDGEHLFMTGNTKLLKTTGVFTDKSFFEVLSFPLVRGNASTVFENPNSIVVTEKFARELFGEKDAFGETVTIAQQGYKFELMVSGIVRDLPANTEYTFDYLIPFTFLESLGEKDTFWGNNSVKTIVKLRDGADVNAVNDQVRDLVKKNYSAGQHIELFLYPLTKMRLHSRFENGVAVGGRIEVMRILALLGAFLVVIAAINFINLFTARAQRRSKEIAVRKVAGAARASLILQFLCESTLVAGIAAVISLGVCYLVLPSFSQLIEQKITLDLTNMQFWMLFGALTISVGLLAGSYPSLYLASFQPIRIMKGGDAGLGGRNTLRSALVVFQFGFALTLIVSALVIEKQIRFVQERNAGYATSNLIHLSLSGDLNRNFAAFSNELMQRNVALSITKTSAPLTEQWSGTTEMKWAGKDPQEKSDIERIYADQGITQTAGLEIVRGRDIDLKLFPTDSSAALINETAAAIMGFDEPIGETIEDAGRQWRIVGVVRDFVFTSPFRKVEPIVLFGAKMSFAFNVVYIRLNPDQPINKNMEILADVSKRLNPDYPFEYRFADLEYQRKFDNIQATLRLTTLFTTVAVFIACLGLFGLAIYMTEARVKEIGIRKVMGGSVLSITRLLGYASLRPIILSIMIFTPLSWFAMNWWLQSFAFRTSINIWTFVAAGLSIIVIALITISAQILRAASANPVTSLRNE